MVAESSVPSSEADARWMGVEAAVARHLDQRPEEIAVFGRGGDLTWNELGKEVERLAARLHHDGIGVGDLVGWFGQNDAGYAITMLACWRLRAAVVGLNWRLPDSTQQELTARIEMTTAIVGHSERDRAGAALTTRSPLVYLDERSRVQGTVKEPAPDRRAEARPGDIAIVYFTSGSTGLPKAVPLTREGNDTAVLAPAPHGFTPHSRLLIVPPVFHLAGSMWTQLALVSGGAQVYLSDPSPSGIIRAMADLRVTHAVLVPTLIRMLLDALREAGDIRLPALQHLAYGASPIPLPLLRETLSVVECELCQVYGMTEAGGVVTRLDPRDHVMSTGSASRLGSAGRATDGVEVAIRDPVSGDVLPAGEPGGVWVRSPSLTPGYLGDPEATAAVITDGWLDTRDIGRLDEDGYLFVVGRADDMIVTGGENVHPGEVEAVMAGIVGVRECAVFGTPDPVWGQRVTVAIVACEGADSEEVRAAIEARCRDELASHQVPRAHIFVSELPRTATGKVQRGILATAAVPGQRLGPRGIA